MKKLVVLLVVSFMATIAFAAVDPTTDSFGIYWATVDQNDGSILSQNNDLNCQTVAPYDSVEGFVVLMNPAGPVDGFECNIVRSGTMTFLAAPAYTMLGTGPMDMDATAGGFAVGCAAPYPLANGGLSVLQISLVPKNTGYQDFFIKKASNPSIVGSLLPAVTGSGVLRACGVASGDVNLPAATLNHGCPVANEPATFGSVKSLFR